MRLIAYFMFLIVGLCAMIALMQIDILNTLIADAGYTMGQVYTGVFSLYLIFLTLYFVININD